MSDHVTFLGDWADWINDYFSRQDAIQDYVITRDLGETAADVHRVLRAITQFAVRSTVGQVTDTMAIGDDYRRGGWGYVWDTLRIVGVLPMGRLARLGAIGVRWAIECRQAVRAVDEAREMVIMFQQATSTECHIVGFVNSANLSRGAHYFSFTDDLVRELAPEIRQAARAGAVSQVRSRIVSRLKELGFGIVVEEEAQSFQQIERMMRRNRLDSVVFSIQDEGLRAASREAGYTIGHSLTARINRAGELLIHDPADARTALHGIGELLRKYPRAERVNEVFRIKQSIVALREMPQFQVGRVDLAGAAALARPALRQLYGDLFGIWPLQIAVPVTVQLEPETVNFRRRAGRPFARQLGR